VVAVAFLLRDSGAGHTRFLAVVAHAPDAGMTYVITQPCIDVKDKSCVNVCPVSCIYMESDELDRKLYIHPTECIECGACEPECPVTAIFFEGEVPPEWQAFIDLDSRWCTGTEADKQAVRARIDEIQPRAATVSAGIDASASESTPSTGGEPAEPAPTR
jgi:ferredoxin